MATKSGLRLGIGLPQGVVGGRADPGLIREFATRAEQLGYADLWLTDNLLGGRPHLEPVTLLAYAAACTEHIRLGVSVIILNQRNPVPLAKALASLDHVQRRRVGQFAPRLLPRRPRMPVRGRLALWVVASAPCSQEP
jgi:alkanesulfonate monooxygenase SsuD/methylene tetrahydromethanopterin reductase-like flavin-dependent oxidoreductase (luciferase family)